jgi:hypothetical protein
MARKIQNPFPITAYYSEDICIIDDKHSYKTCEVLCKLFNSKFDTLTTLKKELESHLQLLLFKLDNNYDAWKNYNKNVHTTQLMLNEIKDYILKFPIYKHTLNKKELDYQDLIHLLNRHPALFDDNYQRIMHEEKTEKEKQKLRDKGVPEEAIERIYDPDRNDYYDDEDYEEEEFPRYIIEDSRYAEKDFKFYDSHVLVDIPAFTDMFEFFQPVWEHRKRTEEEILGAELLNRDLRSLIEPYLDFLETIISLRKTYGVFIDKYVHSKGRYLNSDEIALLFDEYLHNEYGKLITKPSEKMMLECKTIKQGKKSVWCDVYTFESLSAFIYFDFFRGLRQGYIPKKCEHCGKYFLLTSGHYYNFCERIIKGTNGKTCRDIGAHKKYEEKCKSDPVWLAYNRAYKAHYARLLKKKMTKSEFLTWSMWAADYRDETLKGDVPLEEYENKIKK